MNLEELKKYDGKEGRPAYVACNGKIYDVTQSKFWKEGAHMRKFTAGNDLSSSIGASPHGMAALEKYPVVGNLQADAPVEKTAKEARTEMLQKLYAKMHPHPIMVHFPMGVFPFAFFMQWISIMMGGNAALNTASVFAMIFATLFSVPAILSGFASFWINYGLRTNKYLTIKILLSVVVLVLGVLGSIYGAISISSASAAINWKYTIIVTVILPMIGAIGFSGGRLTWPQ